VLLSWAFSSSFADCFLAATLEEVRVANERVASYWEAVIGTFAGGASFLISWAGFVKAPGY
jgi:hypothetical protein